MLPLGHPGDVDECAAIARIDCQRRLQRVLGLFQLAGGYQRAGLALQLGRLGQDLVVSLLARRRRSRATKNPSVPTWPGVKSRPAPSERPEVMGVSSLIHDERGPRKPSICPAPSRDRIEQTA
jgi:hypothetical protein